MKNLEETKFINAGHVKEFIDELEDNPDKYEKELQYLFGIYNKMVNFKAYKLKNDKKTGGEGENDTNLPLHMGETTT